MKLFKEQLSKSFQQRNKKLDSSKYKTDNQPKEIPKKNEKEIKNEKNNKENKPITISKNNKSSINNNKNSIINKNNSNNLDNYNINITKSNTLKDQIKEGLNRRSINSNLKSKNNKNQNESNNNMKIPRSKPISSIGNKTNINNKNENKISSNITSSINKLNNKNIINNNKKEKKSKSFISNINKKKKNKLFEEDILKKIKKLKSFETKNNKININFKKNVSKENIDNDLDNIIKINDLTQGIQKKRNEPQKDSTKGKRKSIDNKIILATKSNFTKENFEVINFSGKGAYGTVVQAYLKGDPNKKVYAIKKLDINLLYSVNRLYQAYLENEILNELDSPYIVKTFGAFEADGKIHIVMEYLPKGDFSYFIKTNFPLKDEIIRFYSAEIVLFLEYMQKMKLIHRDLKPQNIMIDEKGHLKVIDFGTVRKVGYYFDKKEMKFKEEKNLERIDTEDIKGVKNKVNPDEEDAGDDFSDDDEEEEDEDDDDGNDNSQSIDAQNNINEKKKKKTQRIRTKRSMTFVGTAEYISPEVIGDRPAEYGTDIWAFGVMLYQMYFNHTPFKAVSAYLTFRNIEKPQINFPDNDNIPESAKDLIKKILVVDPKQRLGGGVSGTPYDMASLKKHPFFDKIKWNGLNNVNPPGIKDLKFFKPKNPSNNSSINSSINKNWEIINDRYSFEISPNELNRNSNAKVIKEGTIKKKSMLFRYDKKRIILDSTPRLVLISVNDPNHIKEIPLNKKCKITIVENNYFDLKTPVKTYRFKGVNNDGNDWAGIIADVIDAYGRE